MINPTLEKDMLEHLPVNEQEEVLATHEPSKNHEVLIVGGNDYRVQKAFDIEIDGMSELGDKPYEVYEEFVDLNKDSLFLLLFRKGEEKTPENIEGVMRVIPYIEGFGNKTINDLAQLQHMSQESTAEMFKEQAECNDITKVWDIGTLAFPVEYSQAKRAKIGIDLMHTVTKYTVEQYKEGDVTHLTAFNQYQFHDFLLGLGYPFKIFKDSEGKEYTPMVYETFEPGVGMKALPAWVDLESVNKVVEQNRTQTTNRNLANVAFSGSIHRIAS